MLKANALIQLKKPLEAEKELLKLIVINPNNPSAFNSLGMIKAGLKKLDDAYGFFMTAYEKSNQSLEVFLQLVRVHVAKKEYNKALSMCEKQLPLVKDNKRDKAVIYHIQGQVYAAMKEPERVKEFYNKAIETDPEFVEPYNALAKIHMANKDMKMAFDLYSSVLKINPDNPFSHMMIGIIYDKEKKYNQAAEHYQKAIDIDANYTLAINNLAYHLATRTKDIDKAMALIKTAKQILPDDPYIADTFGVVYYEKGLFGNAVVEFLDASQKLPNIAEIHFHLGRAYFKKGEKDNAKVSLKKALELNQKFEGIAEARKILKELK